MASSSDDLLLDRHAPHHSSFVNVPRYLRFSTSCHPAAHTFRADLSLYRIQQSGVKAGPGTDLLSHAVAHAVSSALERFTTVFGMGTGGTTPPAPPGPASTPPSLTASRTHQPASLSRLLRTRGRASPDGP
jgi:hypothetical protein